MNTNIKPYVYLTRALLPKLLKRENRSGVIFTSSIGAVLTAPYLAVYAATKAFNNSFAVGLAY